ncbi:MAG: indole-3-glycerol phosphate synthase TrpC [Patescibacteria group bacterium]
MNQNILDKIIAKKKARIEEQKKSVTEAMLYTELQIHDTNETFYRSITNPNSGDISVIAEIKAASPSAGTFCSEDELIPQAELYREAGVEAISYVTERDYFGGNPELLQEIMTASELPLLQKDFVIDTYQIIEAAIRSVDALLLIARLVEKKTLKAFVDLCILNSIEPVVEVYDVSDLEKLEGLPVRIVGVNARNLTDFSIDIQQAATLIESLHKSFTVIGFSGVRSRTDVEVYRQAGARAVLVGETLMRAEDLRLTVQNLKGI